MKSTKSILTVTMLAFVQTGVTVFSQNFIYNYQTVFDNNAATYIVGEQNVRQYSEWENPPVTYWGPSANDVPAALTMEFGFSAPTTQISLDCNICAANEGSRGDYGYSSLWASTDGISWQLLLNNPEPTTPYGNGEIVYDQNVPVSLLGANDLWLQVRMFEHGALANASPLDTTWADAQFSRIDPNNPPASGHTFDLEVTLVPEPGCLTMLFCGTAVAFVYIRRKGLRKGVSSGTMPD